MPHIEEMTASVVSKLVLVDSIVVDLMIPKEFLISNYDAYLLY